MPSPSIEVPVSVCIPIYNGALYIREAIHSILKQTVIPQEIIVSDSGSSDHTEDIVREEALRTTIKTTILPAKTPGMVSNWNSTIRAVSGKYVKFVFQDDLLQPDCLEKMVALAESDERIGFVFSPRELLVEPSAEGDAITKWLLKYQNLSAAFGELKTNQPGAVLLRSRKLLQQPLNKIGEPTAVLVRTRLFDEVGLFNERMRQLVDMEMWIRLMAICHVGYVSEPLVSVRIHPARASNRQFIEAVDRFEQNCLRDTLRTPEIYPLLHRRVRRGLDSSRRGARSFSRGALTSVQRGVLATSSYIHRYTVALQQLRRVRTVAEQVTFDEAYAFAEAEIGIVQNREELQWLFGLVRAARPRVVLEIGLDFGGTFFLWSRAAALDAHLLAVDAKPVGRFGEWSPFSLVRRGFAIGSQRVTLLMDSDSHSETTRQRVAQLLRGRPIDFLFIDGARGVEGVWQDFNLYSPFVAPGGLVAFHDISQNPEEWPNGVAQFWREFTAQHETRECVAGGEPGFGIGVYRVPSDTRNYGSNTTSKEARVSPPPIRGCDPLIPPDSLHCVGSLGPANFVAVGEEFFRYFVDLCELRPGDRVLDIGSGTGRMARPLTTYLRDGSYEGMDIVAPSVRWCQSAYTSRWPNFHFHFADIYNKAYNPDGKYVASEYLFPFESSSFDFVFLTSVFTHMLPQDMEHYLSEIVRVLKANKRCLATYFLINQGSRKLINEGLSYYNFKYELPGCRVESVDTPESVVGYEESHVRALYAKYGLDITRPVLHGTWCKRKDGLSWQDMIIATNSADCV